VFPISQWAVTRLIHVPLLTYLRQFLVPLISAGVMAIAIVATKQLLVGWINLPALLVICIVIGSIIYGLLIRLLSPLLFQRLLELARFSLIISSKHQNN
jgi:predicted PurR-regulated permease PerM